MQSNLNTILLFCDFGLTWHFIFSASPNYLIEWRYGMRKYGYGYVLLGAVFMSLSHYSPVFGLLFVVFLGLGIISWNDASESKEILEVCNTGKSFLLRKMLGHLLLFFICILPVVVLWLCQYPQWWYISLILYLVVSLGVAFSIAYKYAVYHPARRKAGNSLPVAIFVSCTMVPFFAPVCIVYFVIYTGKAIRRISEV